MFLPNERRDWTTHLADAFRYLSLAWRNIPIEEPKGIDPQWLQDWQKVIPPRPGQVPLPAPPEGGSSSRIKL